MLPKSLNCVFKGKCHSFNTYRKFSEKQTKKKKPRLARLGIGGIKY